MSQSYEIMSLPMMISTFLSLNWTHKTYISSALLLMPCSHHSALHTPISQGFVALLCGTERTELKGASLSAIPQCPAPREPKWKVCFSTRWVRRWKSFGMTWVYGQGTRGSTELFIPSGVLWLGSTHSSCPFSPAASRRSVQSWPVCWWITWENERAPSSPFSLWTHGSPNPGWKPSPEHPCIALGRECSYKKMKGSRDRVGWGWTFGVGRGFGGTAVAVFMGAI